MLSFTFFALSALMVLAYGLQGALQAKYIRKYDALTVGVYRNISLSVTMLPILFLVPAADILRISEHLGTLFLASTIGALGLWCSFSSAHYLPIGFGTALRQVAHTVTAVALGALFFSELLSPSQLLLLALIMFSGISLILARVDHDHLDPRLVMRGVGLALLAGVIVAHSFYFLSLLSREVDPLVAAYFWEAGVGIVLLFLFIARQYRYPKRVAEKVNFYDARTIIAISLLTIVGTVSYASAATHGPYALVSGLMSMTTLVSVLMGWYLYSERVSRLQGILISFSIACVILLKLLS